MKISVITVCKNEENTIAQTIESVLMQKYTDYEYIILDGNSSDKTKQIINQYANKISKYISEDDKGIFYAMNKAIDLSDGEYLIFINSGDLFVNDYVLKNVSDQLSNYDLVIGDVIFKYKSGSLLRRKYPVNFTKQYFLYDSINHQATFTKRELFNRIGKYDQNFKITADYEFSMRAIIKNNCTLKFLNFPVSYFNLEGISSKSEYMDEHFSERQICLERYFDKKALREFNHYRILYDIFFKKLRYLYFLVRSKFSKGYLYG